MFSRYLLLTQLFFFLILPILVLVIWTWLHLYKSLPNSDDLTVKGIDFPIVIEWDEQGVPIINTKTDHDAYFAMGYIHARDRLWQLEIQRRLAQGRLSEIFGRTSIDYDVWMRTLGLYKSAEQAWTVLSREAQQSLTAYANGVNAWLTNNPNLPIEFKLLGVTPERWREVDSLVWTKIFALNLAGNFRKEIANMVLTEILEEDKLATFFNLDTTNNIDKLVGSRSPLLNENSRRTNLRKGVTDNLQSVWLAQLSLADIMQTHLGLGGKFVGSNAWVVSSKHTKNSVSLLANDPHLSLQIPSLWYAAKIKGDQLNTAGMTLVGLPVVIFGHNQNIAWGGTSMMADVQDVYVEQVNPLNTEQYKTANGWQNFKQRVEHINVRADFPDFLNDDYKPLEVEIKQTTHGPVISDVFGELNQFLSLRWTALEKNDSSYEAFYRLNYAYDWNSFKSALSYHVAPALNMLYSDSLGNIGSLGIGRVPIRGQGQGSLPLPAYDSSAHWQGYIPFEQLPQRYNPSEGFIISANNNIADPGYSYFISNEFAPEARAVRIRDLLLQTIKQNKDITVSDMQRIQSDTLDLSAHSLLPQLLKIRGATPLQKSALDLLNAWNGDMKAKSSAATIFHAWVRHIRIELFSDELKTYWNRSELDKILQRIVNRPTLEQIGRILRTNEANWCDLLNTETIENCESVLIRALEEALSEIEKLTGQSNIKDWRWGDFHETLYTHSPFSEMKILDKIFERRISNGGSENSINVASASYELSEGYVQRFGPGFRQVIAMGEQTDHWFVNSTGQSGNLLSTNYDDMIEPFRNGKYFSLSNEKSAHSVFRLLPVSVIGYREATKQ